MRPLLDYFDLNKRAFTKPVAVSPVPPSSGFAAKPLKTPIPVWKQLTFYLGTIVGVLASSSIMQFQAGKVAMISLTVTAVILSAIIALVIMPHIYEKAVKPDAPFIVQFGLFVQEGVFWAVVLTSIGKAFG
jgi:hypothetical protein